MSLKFFQKIVFPLLILTVTVLSGNAQSSRGNYNFLDFQQKPYYFGITLGFNSSNYHLDRSKSFSSNKDIRIVEGVNGPGWNLGIVTNLKIGRYFDLRFLPTLSFAERKISYTSTSREQNLPYSRSIQSVFIETPFLVRFKSEPYHDMRMFVIGGVKYVYDVASDSRSRQADELVKVAPADIQVELGAGIQFFMPFFIFSPELKFSHGLGNILLYDDNLQEASVLEKLISRGFTLSLHFEG